MIYETYMDAITQRYCKMSELKTKLPATDILGKSPDELKEIIERKISDLNDKLSTTHPLVEGLEKLPDEDIKHVYENVKHVYNDMLISRRERSGPTGPSGDLEEPSFLSSLTPGWVSNVFNKIGTSIGWESKSDLTDDKSSPELVE